MVGLKITSMAKLYSVNDKIVFIKITKKKQQTADFIL